MKRCSYLAVVGMLLFVAAGDGAKLVASATSTTPEIGCQRFRELDEMLTEYASDGGPGFAVGVVMDGQLVYAQGFGLANIEYRAPITPRSPFYIASVSKQFTAACAALLVERGQLQLTDDIRKYLPELPDYGHRITVDHLLHHTSGVRDWASLVLFRGEDPRYEQHVGHGDVVRLLCRQKQLNFLPGSMYRYSNGGYVLLATLLERVTGNSLREFSQQEIFEPLGMRNTRYEDNYSEILPGRVVSYRRTASGNYERFLKHFDVYGDGGIVSSLEDMAKWDAQFRTNSIGGERFLDLMHTKGRLNDGRKIPYAFGLMFDSYHGRPTIEHSGGMLGYRADYVRFPDDDISIIILGNSGTAAGLGSKIADHILFSSSAELAVRQPADIPPFHLSEPNNLTGHYWISSSNRYRRIVDRDGKLLLDWGPRTQADELVPESESRFHVVRDGQILGVATLSGQSEEEMVLAYSSVNSLDGFSAVRYDPTPPCSREEVSQFVGNFFSEELDVTYTLSFVDDALMLRMGEAKALQLYPPAEPIVWNSKDMVFVGIGEITFRRNQAGRVIGLSIGDNRVSRVDFLRCE